MGGTSQSAQDNSASSASAPSLGNVSGNVPFAPFMNSPIGQQVFGGGQSQAGGSATPRGFIQTLQDQNKYWRGQEAAMTPADKSRQQFLQSLANSNPPPSPVQPASFRSSQPSTSLSAVLEMLAKNRA